MSKKVPRVIKKSVDGSKSKDLDILLEEYMSKLEQKVVSQTQQLKTITDNAASCLFMLDMNGLPTFMNPAAEQATGYSLEEIKDKVLHTVIHHKHPDGLPYHIKVCPITNALKARKQVKDQEEMFVRKDNSFFPISFSIAPLTEDGKPHGAVLEFQDITKRKELERQKDDFIGMASHELKTPVTSMKTYTQVLRKKFEKQGDVLAAESMAKIDVQINKLTSLIADLLDVTRTQTGNLHLHQESFDVDTLVEEVVESMQLTTHKHTITIKGKRGMHMTADRDRTSQVLINYLSNAIKYSPQSSKIFVHVTGDDNEVIVGVQDFGIGIPPDKKDQVFERFMRVSGPSMETFSGLGLGLYISAHIITRQNGRVWVESKENKGSTFYFSLPCTAKISG
ncbi:MAG: PAS domain-containing sensor histidine kinase [Candidatus Levybacteria bacterium]|nr:PAS domain-containing sensor histidine kinase [Candidatus Levybacteria bacterium]